MDILVGFLLKGIRISFDDLVLALLNELGMILKIMTILAAAVWSAMYALLEALTVQL